MNILEQKIKEKINKEGPIKFAKFMEMSLYEAGLGYYTSEQTYIGKAGDFYTSQHVHQIFGTMIGRQIEEMWRIMEKPSEFFIIESGAGMGYMCKDIMDYLNKRNILEAFTYLIIEINPSLYEKQKKLLACYDDKVKWLQSIIEINGIKGCVVSNELLDSFPVHIIVMEDELKEIYVGFQDNEFKEIPTAPVDESLINYINEFSIDIQKGYRTEINLKIKEWLMALTKTISEGFIITIDYGYSTRDYYSEERNRGTLLCYHKHQLSENPYENIGKQDITAHINFSSVKKWGEELGFKTLGFCQQGTYLVSLGIDELIREIFQQSNDYLFEIAKIKRLILPGTIGETHKVMIQYKGDKEPSLRGFMIRNQKDIL